MRYSQIIDVINEVKPKKILEVGTWNGVRAVEMCQAALVHSTNVSYLGFDLFEDATSETDAHELNVKPHAKKDDIKHNLTVQLPACTVSLVSGNTNITLQGFKGEYDFAFIDGGHSLETVQNDGENTNHIPVRLFDDYYSPDNQGKLPDITKFGCNHFIDSLDKSQFEITILPKIDRIRGGGFNQIVKVVLKSQKKKEFKIIKSCEASAKAILVTKK